MKFLQDEEAEGTLEIETMSSFLSRISAEMESHFEACKNGIV
jgi:hypothetical protein